MSKKGARKIRAKEVRVKLRAPRYSNSLEREAVMAAHFENDFKGNVMSIEH